MLLTDEDVLKALGNSDSDGPLYDQSGDYIVFFMNNTLYQYLNRNLLSNISQETMNRYINNLINRDMISDDIYTFNIGGMKRYGVDKKITPHPNPLPSRGEGTWASD